MEEAETNLALKKLQPLWIALLPELSSLFGNSPWIWNKSNHLSLYLKINLTEIYLLRIRVRITATNTLPSELYIPFENSIGI